MSQARLFVVVAVTVLGCGLSTLTIGCDRQKNEPGQVIKNGYKPAYTTKAPTRPTK